MTETVFPYVWQHERRFNAYANYFRKTFGQRVQKLSIHAGFTCPNRDGNLGQRGCTFCNNEAFNPSYCTPSKTITQQLDEGISFHERRYRKAGKYLAYFQPYSNTYAPLATLVSRYEEALAHPQVVGLVIGTRPDCVDAQKLDYIASIAEKYYVIVEYGIESCSDRTLDLIQRGHSFAQTKAAIEQTAERGIKTGGHLIFGLPGESPQEMLSQAEILSELPLTSVKFHQLQIFKNTPMEEDFKQHPEHYHFFRLKEYIDFVIDFLERLNPYIVVERFAGEVPPRFQASEAWGNLRYEQVFAMIERRLQERDTYQGKLFKGLQ